MKIIIAIISYTSYIDIGGGKLKNISPSGQCHQGGGEGEGQGQCQQGGTMLRSLPTHSLFTIHLTLHGLDYQMQMQIEHRRENRTF